MASPANLLRLCLRPGRRLPRLPTPAARRPALRQTFSTTPWRSAEQDPASTDDVEEGESYVYKNPGEFLKGILDDDTISPQERAMATRMLADWQDVPVGTKKEFDNLNQEVFTALSPLRRIIIPKRDSFWNTEESDSDLVTDEIGEDDFEEDDIMALGHAKLEEHREFREYARLAVWEMPLLSSKPAGYLFGEAIRRG